MISIGVIEPPLGGHGASVLLHLGAASSAAGGSSGGSGGPKGRPPPFCFFFSVRVSKRSPVGFLRGGVFFFFFKGGTEGWVP